jgi:hypothetical protein
VTCDKASVEKIADWNIKGRYHYVTVYVVNSLLLLRFERYQVGQFVVPQWYHA